MKAGKLNKKIAIQSFTTVANDYGELVQTWATYHTPFAEVKHRDGTEFTRGGETISKLQTTFIIRYKEGISVKDRIIYGGETYQIESINNFEEKNREQHIKTYKIED